MFCTLDLSYLNPGERSVASHLNPSRSIIVSNEALVFSGESGHTFTSVFICLCFVLHTQVHTSWGGKQTTHRCARVCVCVCSLLSPSANYTEEKKKYHCPLSDMYTFHPCDMSKLILWLNPGKNVKNAWLDTRFSSKNTTVLINCSTWRRLFNTMYIFVSG